MLYMFSIKNKDTYELVCDRMYFNKARNEREVFDMWYDGENNCTIAKRLNISEGTVRNRKKALSLRADDLIKKTYNMI